jgi:hypothetical protein
MDTLEKTRGRRAAKSRLSAFGDSAFETKEAWIEEMRRILLGAARALHERRYMAVFVGDLYRGNEYHQLGAAVVGALAGTDLVLKANLIWYDVSKSLHVYGYPAAFVPSLTHQNILVFRKESQA